MTANVTSVGRVDTSPAIVLVKVKEVKVGKVETEAHPPVTGAVTPTIGLGIAPRVDSRGKFAVTTVTTSATSPRIAPWRLRPERPTARGIRANWWPITGYNMERKGLNEWMMSAIGRFKIPTAHGMEETQSARQD